MANPYFNAAYYLTNNPDLFAAGINTPEGAWNHYVTYGAAESLASGGRKPAPWFDAKYYLESNPDLSTAGLNPGDLFEHFTNYGLNEGRAPAAGMGVTHDQLKAYAAANEDLREAFGIEDVEDISEEQYDQLAQQFYQYGYQEDRDGAPFDAGGVDPDAGETFTLTTGVDNIVGTTGNDTIIADNTGTTAQLTAADQIDGKAGNDTLKIYQAATTNLSSTVLGQLSNVENLYVNNGTLTDGSTWDISGAAGVNTLTVDSTVAMANDAAGGFTIKTTAAQSVSLTKVKGTAGGATSTVSINGATTVTLNKFDTDVTLNVAGTNAAQTINTTGAASAFTLTNSGAKLASLAINGDQKVSVTQALGDLTTIDASGNSGAVTIDASALGANNNLTFTGGEGNDVLVFKAAYLTKDDVLDGGAGKDTLVINDTTPVYAGINAAKNFEVVALGTSGATVDIAQITNGINEFSVREGNITATFNNALSSSKFNVDLKAGNTGTVTVANKVGENTTSVALDNQDGGAQALGNLTVNGASIINLSSTGKAAADVNTLTAFVHSDNATINVAGNADLVFTVDGTTTGSKVDAASFTGKLEVTSSGKGDVLIGGSGADTFKVGIKDTVTGNAGKDTFNFDSAKPVNSGQDVDVTITDFAVGDKVVLVAKGTETWTKTKLDVSTASSLGDALGLAAAGDGGTNAIVKWFQFDGNTYLVEDLTTGAYAAATDLVIKLTGLVDLSSISALSGAGGNELVFA